MKVGKESIAGTIAALEAWEKRNHAAVRARESGYHMLWPESLSKVPGLRPAIVPTQPTIRSTG